MKNKLLNFFRDILSKLTDKISFFLIILGAVFSWSLIYIFIEYLQIIPNLRGWDEPVMFFLSLFILIFIIKMILTYLNYKSAKYYLNKSETNYIVYNELIEISEMFPSNKKDRFNKHIHLLDPLIPLFFKILKIKLEYQSVDELYLILNRMIFKYDSHYKKLYKKLDSENETTRFSAGKELVKLAVNGRYPAIGNFFIKPELYSSILFNTSSYSKTNPISLKELERIKNTLQFDVNANYMEKQKREFIKKALISTIFLKEYIDQSKYKSNSNYYLSEIKHWEESWFKEFFKALDQRG